MLNIYPCHLMGKKYFICTVAMSELHIGIKTKGNSFVSNSAAEKNLHCHVVVGGVITEWREQYRTSINARDRVGAVHNLHA